MNFITESVCFVLYGGGRSGPNWLAIEACKEDVLSSALFILFLVVLFAIATTIYYFTKKKIVPKHYSSIIVRPSFRSLSNFSSPRVLALLTLYSTEGITNATSRAVDINAFLGNPFNRNPIGPVMATVQ